MLKHKDLLLKFHSCIQNFFFVNFNILRRNTLDIIDEFLREKRYIFNL